ncbi:MAG: hypothetical protein GXO83_09925 [Chlorobi bacterium]|nr:hypothetical protein [Chlorobiota bacterium]
MKAPVSAFFKYGTFSFLFIVSFLSFYSYDQQLYMPGRLTVSQGTYPGVVHLTRDTVLYIYDNISWKRFSGDFSNGTTPAPLLSTAADLNYIYGDGADMSAWNALKSLKSAKYTR